MNDLEWKWICVRCGTHDYSVDHDIEDDDLHDICVACRRAAGNHLRGAIDTLIRAGTESWNWENARYLASVSPKRSDLLRTIVALGDARDVLEDIGDAIELLISRAEKDVQPKKLKVNRDVRWAEEHGCWVPESTPNAKRQNSVGGSRRAAKSRFIDDAGTCRRCGIDSHLTIDHIIPLSRGGTDDAANWQVLCRRCNSSKGARLEQ